MLCMNPSWSEVSACNLGWWSYYWSSIISHSIVFLFVVLASRMSRTGAKSAAMWMLTSLPPKMISGPLNQQRQDLLTRSSALCKCAITYMSMMSWKHEHLTEKLKTILNLDMPTCSHVQLMQLRRRVSSPGGKGAQEPMSRPGSQTAANHAHILTCCTRPGKADSIKKPCEAQAGKSFSVHTWFMDLQTQTFVFVLLWCRINNGWIPQNI